VIQRNTKALETSCTSGVKNMDFLFFKSDLNPDISSWDVSNVQNMNYMFYGAVLFNANISSWDVSNVKTMYAIFHNAESFDQDISTWVIRVKKTNYYKQMLDIILPKRQEGISQPL